MWEQPALPLDGETDLKGVWENISVDQRREFIAACSKLLVKVASKSQAQEKESDDE